MYFSELMLEPLRAEVCKRQNIFWSHARLKDLKNTKRIIAGHEPHRAEVISFLLTCISKTDA